MFGYVRYDMPYLYVKDLMLYKALYCGLCKSIGASCGQMARLGLSFDVTFLSAILHNLAGTDIVIEKQKCFEHAFKKHPMAKTDALSEELGALNTVLCYYKLADDREDGEKRRFMRFKKGFARANKRYPELVGLVREYMAEQAAAEKAKTDSLDRAADPTAMLVKCLSRHFLGEKANGSTDELFYGLGKWIYLIDALDDLDKDVKRGNYNPFALAYGAKDRKELMERRGADVAFVFDTLFYSLREGLAGCRFYFNRDLTDNVVLRGIPSETARVMKGDPPVRMTVKV